MDLNNAWRILLTCAPEDALEENHSSNSATPASELLTLVSSDVVDGNASGARIERLPLPTDAKPDTSPIRPAHGSNHSDILFNLHATMILEAVGSD